MTITNKFELKKQPIYNIEMNLMRSNFDKLDFFLLNVNDETLV